MRHSEARLVTGVVVEVETSSTSGCCCSFCCNDLVSCVYNQSLCMIMIMQTVIFYIVFSHCESCREPGDEAPTFFDRVNNTTLGQYLSPVALCHAVIMSTVVTFAAVALRRGVLDRKPTHFVPYMLAFPTMVMGYGCILVTWGVAAAEYVAPLQLEDYTYADPSQRVISPAEVVALVVLALLLLLAAALYCMVNVYSLYKHYKSAPLSVEHFYFIG